ncbi:DUF4145 domain-containing protein [Snodgrassella sp.]|uniref:DUF4145 domain-containing protein n=1 Tax=Snodgrassella sp. TaxID=2815304 RepID=UPI00258CDEEF|nr:DUF4145 domain-containing protein [Snodgrassella sp.]MCO6525512.1 DUF4145 domain-containing protein [Snodgrassella sp.]
MGIGKSWSCPHCNRSVIIRSTDKYISCFSYFLQVNSKGYILEVTVTICPSESCGKETIKFSKFSYFGKQIKDALIYKKIIEPEANIKIFDCSTIPYVILEDYKEAKLILNLSPKASATLARRCLQSMIRDFHGITGKRTLHQEIEAIEDRIDPEMYKAIMALKSIGNIGAHPEHDINLIIDVSPEEACQLVNLIEMLIDDWYVTRERRQERVRAITAMNEQKQQERKTPET